jgi:hypothetical protein
VDAIEVAADGEAAQETRAGVFFARMNAPYYSAGPRSQGCGPALCRTPTGAFPLLAIRPLDFPNFLKFFPEEGSGASRPSGDREKIGIAVCAFRSVGADHAFY